MAVLPAPFSPKTIEVADDIRNIIQSIHEAQEFQKINPDESIRIMAESQNVFREHMLSGLDAIFITDLDENIKVMDFTNNPTLKNSIDDISQFYLERGQISYKPTFDDIIEPKFVFQLRE